MPLPTSRNTSYAPTDPVKSADLNDIQDQIISLASAITGARTRQLPIPMASVVGGTLNHGAGRVSLAQTDPTDSLVFPLLIPVGSIIQRVSLWIYENNDPVTVVLEPRRRLRDSGSIGNIGLDTLAAEGLLELTGINHTVESLYEYWVWVRLGAVPSDPVEFTWLEVEYDDPGLTL